MIVPSMNINEIIREIEKDNRILTNKGDYLVNKIRRKIIKSKKKIVTEIFEHRSKNNNNYLLLIEASKKMNRRTICCYYIDQFGLNAIMIGVEKGTVYHISPHFLTRLNERLLKQPKFSKLDILKQFILNNIYLVDITDSNYHVVIKMNEGYGLGYEESISGYNKINYLRTFISNGMVMDHQKDKFNNLKELYFEFQHELSIPPIFKNRA